MTESFKLRLPYIEGDQAQKHVTHNEALELVDALLQASVLDKDLADPPSSPTNGDAYIVAATATGDWVGKENDVAVSTDGIWKFYTPNTGWEMWVLDESAKYRFTSGSGWAAVPVVSDTPTFSQLGVGGATPDGTNKLSVNSGAILFNRATDDVQVKLNKEVSGDSATFLFQTGFSARAEIGTAGNDDFTFKVSPDGSTFYNGIVIDKDTGAVAVNGATPSPNGGLSANGWLIASGSNGYFNIRDDGALDMGRTGGGAIYIRTRTSGSTLFLGATNDAGTLSNMVGISSESGSVFPPADDSTKFGAASNRWSELFAANSTINTSDAALKSWAGGLSDAEKRVGQKLKSMIGKFMWLSSVEKKGDHARINIGVLAQDVYDAFKSEGLDAGRYSMWCRDPKTVQEISYVKVDGQMTQVAKQTEVEGEYTYGIRYSQLICFILASI